MILSAILSIHSDCYVTCTVSLMQRSICLIMTDGWRFNTKEWDHVLESFQIFYEEEE